MSKELKSTQVCYGEDVLMMRVDDCLIFGNKDALQKLAKKLEERTAKATRNPKAFFYHCECGCVLCCEKNDMNYCPQCGCRLIWGDDDE